MTFPWTGNIVVYNFFFFYSFTCVPINFFGVKSTQNSEKFDLLIIYYPYDKLIGKIHAIKTFGRSEFAKKRKNRPTILNV